jgi:hypothetical protein
MKGVHPMPKRVKGVFSTLKHGGYSAKTILLPGESPAKFKRLERDVINDLRPDGALERDTVGSIVKLVWRKQNLATFRKAQLVKERYEEIRSEYIPPESFMPLLECEENEENKPRREGGLQAAEDQARKELGKSYQLVAIGETATVDCLMRESEVEERLDARIDKHLKRLLFLRGLKSLPRGPSSTPPNSLPAPA